MKREGSYRGNGKHRVFLSFEFVLDGERRRTLNDEIEEVSDTVIDLRRNGSD